MSARKGGEPQGFPQTVAEILIRRSYYLPPCLRASLIAAGPQRGSVDADIPAQRDEWNSRQLESCWLGTVAWRPRLPMTEVLSGSAHGNWCTHRNVTHTSVSEAEKMKRTFREGKKEIK